MVTNSAAVPVGADLLDRMVDVARDAGAAIMRHYTSGAVAAVDWKRDRSPVTEADHAAHRVIAAGLAHLLPGTPVVSEEGWIPAPEEQGALRRFWLVDPLDGTKEYLSRNGEFTVNIALIDNERPVAGVVLAPAVDLLYYAAADCGSWRCALPGGAPVRLQSTPRGGLDPLVVVESRSHPSEELEAWLATVTVARRVAAGSSLKLCWLADGSADVYPRFGTTMEWDIAAGDCVFRWSGAGEGRWSTLRYNKPGFRNGPFVLGLDAEDPRVS